LLLLGIGVGLWYLAILALVLKRSGQHDGAMSALPGIVIAVIGLLTIGGCISRLKKPSSYSKLSNLG